MKHQLSLVCLFCFGLGIVLQELVNTNWIVGMTLAFILGLVIGRVTLNKKIVEDKR